MARLQARLKPRALIAVLAWALAGAALAQADDEEPTTEPGLEEAEPEAGPPKPPAADLPDRPLMLRLGASHIWESNVFRSPEARAERVGALTAGLSLDKSYAQQRFRLDLSETAYRYENSPQLDFEALNYVGEWTWRLTPRIGGALNAARTEALADYGDFRNPGVLNVRTVESFLATADAWLFGGWHLAGGLSRLENRFTVPLPQVSYRANGVEAGTRWVARSTNWLAFNLRSFDAHYVDAPLVVTAFIGEGFRRREAELAMWWRMGGKSSIDGRLVRVDYRSSNLAERDFSGIAARLAHLWQLSAKLGFNTLVSRDVEPWIDVGANHRVAESVTLGPVWQPAVRTTLRLNARRIEADYRDPLPGFAGTQRRDVYRGVQLEAEWRALRNLSVKAELQRYRQRSTDPATNYRGNLIGLGLSLLL